MACIRHKKNGSYKIIVSCGYDLTGKKLTKSTTFTPDPYTKTGKLKADKTIEKEVTDFANRFEKMVSSGQYTAGHEMTLEVYTEKYLEEYAKENQAPRTLQSTRSALSAFVADFGYMTLETLTPLFLQGYFNNMAKRKSQTGSGTISHGTVKRKAAVLSAALSQAVRWNLLSSNPMERVQVKDRSTGTAPQPVKCFSQDQAEKFLQILDSPMLYSYASRSRTGKDGKVCHVSQYQSEHMTSLQLRFFFYLAMFTGCRRGELIALKWSDLDLESGSVSISKSVCRVNGEMLIKSTKTNSSRLISIPQVVASIGRQWKREQAEYRLSIGSQWIGEGNVFTRWNGQIMGLDTPYQAFHRIIEHYNATRQPDEIELPLIPLHGLRHTAATLLIANGVDVRTVSGRLGHANTSTTLNIYSHALEEFDRKAADVLEQVLTFKKA